MDGGLLIIFKPLIRDVRQNVTTGNSYFNIYTEMPHLSSFPFIHKFIFKPYLKTYLTIYLFLINMD